MKWISVREQFPPKTNYGILALYKPFDICENEIHIERNAHVDLSDPDNKEKNYIEEVERYKCIKTHVCHSRIDDFQLAKEYLFLDNYVVILWSIKTEKIINDERVEVQVWFTGDSPNIQLSDQQLLDNVGWWVPISDIKDPSLENSL